MSKKRALSEEADRFCDDVGSLVEKLTPLFGDCDSAVVGAVLGRLVAAWLNAHVDRDEAASIELRARLFDGHIEFVRQLLVIEHEAFERWKEGGYRQ
jgi:hypothetical protein